MEVRHEIGSQKSARRGETQNKYRYSETGRQHDEDRAKRNKVPDADVTQPP
jgi:hypothetical protein